MKIKWIILTSLCVFYFNSLIAQQTEQTFKVITTGNHYSNQQIIESLEAADLCGFYYVSEKRKMTFDDGTVVELDSSEDLTDLNESCFISKSPAHRDEYWKITNDGHLLRVKQTYGK